MLIKDQLEVHLHTGRGVHFHPSQFTRPSFSIFKRSGSETTAPGAEQSSAERTSWLVTEKAEAAWFPHFMYSSVCFDSKYASEKALKIGGDLRMNGISCI